MEDKLKVRAQFITKDWGITSMNIDEQWKVTSILICVSHGVNNNFLKYKKNIKSIENILNPLSLVTMSNLRVLGLTTMSDPRMADWKASLDHREASHASP
jgi:hypothetical protein